MGEKGISKEETSIMLDASEEKQLNGEEYPTTREEWIFLVEKKEKEASLAAKMGRMLLESNKKLTESNESLMEQINLKKNQLDLALQRVSVVEEELMELKRNNNLLESQNRQFCEANEKLLGDFESLEKEVVHLRNASKEIESITVNRDSLRKQLDEMESIVESGNIVESDLKRRIKRLEEENIKIQSERNLQQQEIFKLREDLECFQIDAKQNISSSNLQLESKLKDLNLENFQLRQELIQSQDQFDILNSLREENEFLKREKDDQLELFQQSKEEIDSMRRKLEKNKYQSAAEQQVVKIDSLSLFDELEEQVVSRVKADLLKAQSEGQSESNQEPNTNQQQTLTASNGTSKIAEIDAMDQGNNLWVNFVSYLPALKSAKSTSDLVETLSTQQLKELLDVLSRVVEAYSGRLVEVLHERDEITREREIRSAFVLQLTQGSTKSSPRGRSNSNKSSPRPSPVTPRRNGSVPSSPSAPSKKKSWFWGT
eukprot:TRINITY_DN7113_c0_g1_i1.p1 TRINITY_DN7113_c0_g1~~TRINITY_DN7113_c0_g1_i1.p1  ORF type:complete len:487 (-),score=176.70 TRINITY_DN7113_c0_g1_i1:30-1490(-)